MTANRKYKTEPECNDVECAYDFSVVMLAVVYSTQRSELADMADIDVFLTVHHSIDFFKLPT